MKVLISIFIGLALLAPVTFAADRNADRYVDLWNKETKAQGGACIISDLQVQVGASENRLIIILRSSLQASIPIIGYCGVGRIVITVANKTEGLLLYNAAKDAERLICNDSNIKREMNLETIDCNQGLQISAAI